MPRTKLFLLDAYALIFRSYYAFINTSMRSTSGVNTSTAYGFLLTLDEVLRNEKPENIAVVFDPSGPNFRHELYPAYKANRDETPEEIKISVPIIKRLLDAMNIKTYQVTGFEADDVIGTLAKKAAQQDFDVYMMTPDKDYGQLVDEHIFMYKPKKGGNESEILGVNEINNKYNIQNPIHVIDILALWGDSSDNVPGVKGIGEKQALELISTYGTIDNLLNNLDKIKPAQKNKILESIDNLHLSKKLVTIDIDVPVDFIKDESRFVPYNDEALSEILQELNFKSLINRFISKLDNQSTATKIQKQKAKTDAPNLFSTQTNLFESDNTQINSETIKNSIIQENFNTIKSFKNDYILCNSPELIADLIKQLEDCNEFCFDTETTGLDTYNDFVIGISFAIKEHSAWYLPISLNIDEAFRLLHSFKHIFSNIKISKIGHNLKFDILMLQKYGLNVQGSMFDTMVAHYVINPELSHKMDSIAEQMLNYKTIHIEELIGSKGIHQKKMSQVPIELIKDYACEDADITLQLKNLLKENIDVSDYKDLFYNIESELLKVLIDMEQTGILLDADSLSTFAEKLKIEIDKTEQEIYSQAGEKFNIASPKQLGDILFLKLQIDPNAKQTKTKQFSTAEDVLQNYASEHPIVNNILEYRSLTKLLSTYVEALPKLINQNTGRIHTSFNQTVAATGRLSSNNPNMQNIPIRDDRGKEMRKAFKSSDDVHILLSADYSQIELRIMAHLCGDKNMIQAFSNNEDIHNITASKIYGIPIEQVTKEQRRNAKTANFGIIYGISTFGLSQRLNIPRKEANDLIEGYFRTFPGVRSYMTQCIVKAKDIGWVETIMHRKRFLPDINSKNAVVRGLAERNAINAPIQGSAADIIKLAMVNIFNEFNNQQLQSKLLLQVHDELVFDVLVTELDRVKEIVKNKMETAVKLSVPLLVEMGFGKNWLDAH